MKRDEEIIKASVDYNADKGKLHVIGGDAILSDEEFIAFNQNASFINGAKWADENPRKGLVNIEKVCKWLEQNISRYLFNTGKLDEYIPTCSDKLYDDLKKAMKE